jgi:hypothetical protein
MCAFRLTVGNDGWGRTKHPYDNLNDLLARKLFGEELRDEMFDIVTRQMRLAYLSQAPPQDYSKLGGACVCPGLSLTMLRVRSLSARLS